METDVKILNDSKKRLQKLKILTNFFKQPDLLGIMVRTEIIHTFFEKNKGNLDLNKLELFHLQYTDSLIELLQKIKKQKEATILSISTEIDTNKSYIEEYINKQQKNDFQADQSYHNSEISTLLETVYSILIGSYKPYSLTIIRSFPNQYVEEYFRDVNDITPLLALPQTKFYVLEDIKVERLLLSRLEAKNFNVRFLCGYQQNGQAFELFRILGSEDEFLWNLQTNTFYILKESIKHQLNREKNISNGSSLLGGLRLKIASLKEKEKEVRYSFPEDVIELLKKYRETIDNNDLINEKLNIDEEKNILNSMLELNISK